MVHHIVSWEFKEGFTEEQKQEYANKIKQTLEGLSNCIPGIVKMRVIIDLLPTSAGANAVLDSYFEDEASLAAYQVHPDHVAASQFVRSVMTNRRCLDFFEE